MAKYISPKENLHKSFVYLDDDIVTNSLSALEAGKIDEIVSKGVTAREGGFNGGLGASLGTVSAKVSGGKKSNNTFEEELVRKRTRFSIFETWYDILKSKDGLGRVEVSEKSNVSNIKIGETLQVSGNIETREIFSLVRAYSDYAKASKIPGHPFYVKGEAQKEIVKANLNFEYIFGKEGDRIIPASLDLGKEEDRFTFLLKESWLVNPDISLKGYFTLVGQVIGRLEKDEWLPTIRLLPKIPPTEFERKTVTEMLENFKEVKTFGFDEVEKMGEFNGPAVVVEPIAIFR